MPKPWEQDPDAWKGENNDLIIGVRYRFPEVKRGSGIRIVQLHDNVPELKKPLRTFDKEFIRGIYIGLPEESDWLPEEIREKIVEESEEVVFLFVGYPANNERQRYLYFVIKPSDMNEFEID